MARKTIPFSANKAAIQAEYERLKALFEGAPEKQLQLADKELQRAAFLAVTLDILEDDISKNGYTEEYQNGANQRGRKKTPAADLHVSFTKNYVTIMKQLHATLLDEEPDLDDFDRF